MAEWRSRPVGLRWTIGDVSDRGFEALRLAVWGAVRLFGEEADYAVVVNSLAVAEARRRAGDVPAAVTWHEAEGKLPPALRAHLDQGMAEGVAWKLSPPRLHPERWEIAFDNDCILWDVPSGMRAWLEAGDARRCLMAEDVASMHGRFQSLAGGRPLNAGIRGFPPGFDMDAALTRVLRAHPGPLRSELDEQGLQAAAMSLEAPLAVVAVHEVTICSPFPPHLPHLGTHGVHFVGLNARRLPWAHEGRNAAEWHAEHFDRHRQALYERVGVAPVAVG